VGRQAEVAERWLLAAGAFFALAVVVHNGDHVRRGAEAVSSDVFWVGTLSIVLEVGLVALVCARHRLAPLAAVALGGGLAVGYVVVHFLPERSLLSDSFSSGDDVAALSWFAASLEVAAALAIATAGALVLSQRGGLVSASRPTPGEGTVLDGLRHPLAAAFALSQVVVIVLSFAQR